MWLNSSILQRLGRAAILPSSCYRNFFNPVKSLIDKGITSRTNSTIVVTANKFYNSPSSSTSISSKLCLSSLFQRIMTLSLPQPSSCFIRGFASLEQMHGWGGPHKKFRPPRKPLDGSPFLKGVILKTLIKKPKKPNSANRKCVLVRLSNGKEAIAYVPGIGHNLQEHNIVLVRCGRLQDVPGVKLKCVRGKYDLPHVQKPVK